MIEMPRKSQATVRRARCAVELLFAILGTSIGFLLATRAWGYYVAITDALGSLILHCASGFVIGIIAGALIADLIGKRSDTNGSKARDKDSD
jgi:hypothetical protein